MNYVIRDLTGLQNGQEITRAVNKPSQSFTVPGEGIDMKLKCLSAKIITDEQFG